MDKQKIEYVNIGDKLIRNIKVEENNEPLIDLAQNNQIIVDTSKKHIYDGNLYYSYVRKGIYLKLIEAKNYLPKHIFFLLKKATGRQSFRKVFFNITTQFFKINLRTYRKS